MLKLNVIRQGETETGKPLSIGDQVQYLGHVFGGMVKIQFNDSSEDVAHPACFAELQ